MRLKFLIILFICLVCNQFTIRSSEKKNILILNSYHKGLQWTDEIVKGMNSGLNESKLEKEIFTEFIDYKRFFDSKGYLTELYDLYKVKYQNLKLDVILVSDDYALTFLIEYRDSLFGKVPVVFCGINNPHIYPDSYTGILEDIKYIDNFNLIKQLHPDYSKIYFIVDQTTTGQIIYDRAFKLYLTMDRDFRYEFLQNYSFDELFEKISNLDDKSVILLTAFTKDRNNVYCSYDELIRKLRKSTNVPIYGVWSFYLGRGIVGGKMNSGFDQGYQSAKMANRILNGEKVKNIDIEISNSEYKFDYNEIKNKGISKGLLPKGSVIINHPLSFITENKEQAVFFGVILILLLIIILILWIYIIYRKRKIKEEQRYRKGLELANEELTLAKEKIEESDRLKSAFLTNMSHEIRTPMNGIIGFSKLLKDSPDIEFESRMKYLNLIHKSGYILLDLINDIIDLSKIEANQLKINNSECKLNEILDELLNFFISEKENLEKSEISILVEKEYDYKDLIIFSDGNRIRQVLYNLINNALKFTSKGYIKFGYYVESPNIIFFVKDTGIGLNEKEKEIIFERFRQVDDKATRRYGGSGVGLSISKGIVENLNGKMWVDSEIGKGSTFFFSIPLNIVNNNKKPNLISINPKDYQWPGKTILIVEDSQVSYELLTKFLKDSQVKIIYASDGEQAVDICKKSSDINLVLMDIQLPVMDGLEATSSIKSFNKDLPIIAQTANSMEEDKENIIKAGCNDYISKPINRIELLQKINYYLSSDLN